MRTLTEETLSTGTSHAQVYPRVPSLQAAMVLWPL